LYKPARSIRNRSEITTRRQRSTKFVVLQVNVDTCAAPIDPGKGNGSPQIKSIWTQPHGRAPRVRFFESESYARCRHCHPPPYLTSIRDLACGAVSRIPPSRCNPGNPTTRGLSQQAFPSFVCVAPFSRPQTLCCCGVHRRRLDPQLLCGPLVITLSLRVYGDRQWQ